MAQAGVVTNQIPERAMARGDVRIRVPGGVEKLAAALQAKVDASRTVPDTVTTIRMVCMAGPASLPTSAPVPSPGRRRRSTPSSTGACCGLARWPVAWTPVMPDAGQGRRHRELAAGANYHARDEYIEID